MRGNRILLLSSCLHAHIARVVFFFFFQAEDGIRDWSVTGVQTCALPILPLPPSTVFQRPLPHRSYHERRNGNFPRRSRDREPRAPRKIGRASCRERG